MPPPAQPGTRARSVCDSQDGASQEEDAPLLLPKLDHLYDANVWGEDDSNAVVIPVHRRVTQQIITRW